MHIFLTANAGLLGRYLEIRGDQGLFGKMRKHAFITDNPSVSDVVYGMLEFQYHAHTGNFVIPI